MRRSHDAFATKGRRDGRSNDNDKKQNHPCERAHKCMVYSPTKDWPAIKRWIECVWKHGRKSNKIIGTHVSEPISLSEYRCLLGQRRCKPLGHGE